MTKQIFLFQFGIGGVGSSLINLVNKFNKNNDIQLTYKGIADTTGCVVNEQGISDEEIAMIKRIKGENKHLPQTKEKIINLIAKSKNCIIVDVTASDDIIPFLTNCVKKNYVVISNKKPLCSSMKKYKELVNSKRILYETTVGAGLPVIKTISSMITTGDDIKEINGCFSGTLSFIFSKLDENVPFSSIVKEAKQLGYTEPDPRDDLSGMDVARKALILTRLLGYNLELQDIEVENLITPEFNNIKSVDEFLTKLDIIDDDFRDKVLNAKSKSKVLRYIANIKEGKCSVGLREISENSQIGSLKGTDNIIAITSRRYTNPLTIIGKGAGPEPTAAGVLDNILEFARMEVTKLIKSKLAY